MYAVSNSPAVAVGRGKNSSQAGLPACPWHVVLPATCQRPPPMHVWLVGITGLLCEDLCFLPTAPWASSQPLEAGLPYAPFLFLKIALFFSRLLMTAWIAPLPPEKAIWGNFWNVLPFPVSPVFFPFWCSSILEQVFSLRVSPLAVFSSMFCLIWQYITLHAAECSGTERSRSLKSILVSWCRLPLLSLCMLRGRGANSQHL